jgi:hypothetical protein
MIDDSNNSAESTDAEVTSPAPARFDDLASANAKPVLPIPTSGVGVWIQRAHDARQMLTGRTKALALVMVGGLAIGTLGGTILVREGGSSLDAAPVAKESTAVKASDAETTSQQATTNTGSNDETSAAQVSAMALQGVAKTSPRPRRRRVPPPVQRGQRAYRVAVIR